MTNLQELIIETVNKGEFTKTEISNMIGEYPYTVSKHIDTMIKNGKLTVKTIKTIETVEGYEDFEVELDILETVQAEDQAQTVHHCIIQQSSNTILTVGETAQEAITEYNETYNESLTVNDFGRSLTSDNDIVLMPCTEFLYNKAQGGEELDYFDNGFNVIDNYITETEDFDLADTCLSTQYDEGSHHTYFDSNTYPVFNLKSTLLEIAEDYETPLSYDDVSDISGEIEDHFENEETQDFDEVVFANCTNSNQYPEGKFMLDGEEHYTLSFIHSDLVLILKRGCIIR